MNERKEADLLFDQNIIRWKNDLVLSAEELVDKKKLSEISAGTLAYRKKNFLETVQSAIRTVFEIMTDEEKEKIWCIIKDDIECLLDLIRPGSNRGDIFPESAFNPTTLKEIFSNGAGNIVEFFIRSQFSREGMKRFIVCEKNRQLIMNKIGSKSYLEIMKEISRDKKPAKRK